MVNDKIFKLCRICLNDGATIPIFDKGSEENENSVYNKLTQCLKEKIEDAKGFPCKICNCCNNTLTMVCNFITRYKESSKILENELLVIKNENVINDKDDFDNWGTEFNIKEEPNVSYEESLEDTDSKQLLTKTLELTVKKSKFKKHRISKSVSCNKTNRIATSILEGEFLWSGDKWCLSSEDLFKTKVKTKPARACTNRIVKKKDRIVKQKEIKVKLLKGPKSISSKLCDICGEIFKTHNKLNTHKTKVHFKKPVKCPKCPQFLASEYYLNRHMKRRHAASKEFICAICGQTFAFKGELGSHHKHVHNKHLIPKKIFKCKMCDKTYKCQRSVVVHERSVHTGERPAICNECGTSFYHEDYLREHMRLHTGETPFKCPICGRGYAQRCNMKSHLRIHRLAEIDPDVLSKMRPNYIKLLKDFR